MAASSRIAVFPGSFDPPTHGHLDMVTRASKLFDRVVVALLRNPSKQPFFTLEDRTHLLRDLLTHLPNVEVDVFQGLLVDYVKNRKAAVIVRGIRNGTDLDYEQQMALMNRHLDSSIETVFLASSAEYAYVSSTLVREIATLGGSVRGLVPAAVESRLEQWRDAPRTQRT